jgi:hypothetical protein
MKKESVVALHQEPGASVLAFGSTICKTKTTLGKKPKY